MHSCIMQLADKSQGCPHVCLQEQNEALLAQLHARERTIRDLMQSTGASAADVAAFVSGIDAR
jgi:hypothetical protein